MALSDARKSAQDVFVMRFFENTADFGERRTHVGDYRALYRKWRPVDFDDVSGQTAITDILKYEVAEGKVSHAYLFCGSRGTGKTSCAKILAKAVNCLHPKNGNPCNACPACLAIDRGAATDVLEMDAASNNGVDNVRELKDEISFTPAELKYRVYIIDEVHMMSSSAFNALLKTLEEPPAYVIFILATTELSKLPSTIVSRCQRFDFKRIDTPTIVARLSHIASAEGITLTEGGARMIARAAQGGMRDAVSLLELCAGGDFPVDEEHVGKTVGVGNRAASYRMLSALAESDFATVYSLVGETVKNGADMTAFWQELMNAYRDLSVVKNSPIAREYLDLTDAEYETLSALAEKFTPAKLYYHTARLQTALADMTRVADAGRSIAEMTLTELCDAKLSNDRESLLSRVEDLEKEVAMLKLGAPIPKKEAPTPTPPKAEVPKAPAPQKPQPVKTATTAPEQTYPKWARVIERIGDVKPPLSVQFIGSLAKTADNRSFTAFVTGFFAKKIAESAGDLAIVKGLIAEVEGCTPADISLRIEPKAVEKPDDFSDDFNAL